MNMETSVESDLLINTVRRFVETEMFPHEEQVDRLGHVPEEIGRAIEAKSKELGLYACNLPEEVGGGGLGYRSIEALTGPNKGLGAEVGIAIVIMATILDRLTQATAKRRQAPAAI